MHRIATDKRLTWILLALLDSFALLLAGFAATWFRFGAGSVKGELIVILQHPGFILFALLAQWFLATTFDLYRPKMWHTREQLLVRIVALGVVLPAALALGVYVVLPWRFGRGLLALTVLIALPLQACARVLWTYLATLPTPPRAIIIGEGPIVGALLDEVTHHPSPPFQIVRHFKVRETDSSEAELHNQGVEDADMVIVASMVSEEALDSLAALNFRGTTVVDAAGAYAALTGRIPVLQVDSRWFIATGDFSSLANSPFHNVQRFIDVVITSIFLVATSPLLLTAALAVLVTSGRPVFFTQTRLGKFARPFVLLKLRTLRCGSGENGPAFVAEDDNRVLPIGRILRRWRIDELPQLLNVLRGDMSLVGPRPERPEVAEGLEREIPYFAYRYSVRPGITGWAQINVPYCSRLEDHVVKLEHDLYSLRHHGPTMYLLVLIRTLGALVFRPGR